MRSPFPILALLSLILFPSPLAAQTANPSLTARLLGINSPEATAEKLRIESLDVNVRVHGTIAETIVTARFVNPVDQTLEGDFRLVMPAGSVVTGYALDLNGRMIDGVLVDQRRARVAYEARVRGRIDPGLAEVDRDNLFRTRVFPIFPRSGRTIRLRFTTPLDPARGYSLPIDDTAEIGRFRLEIEASGTARPPELRLPGGGEARWSSAGGVHRFEQERRGARLDGALAIAPAELQSPILVSRGDSGERFFQIADSAPVRRERDAPEVRRVAVLWDRSLSRADDDLEEEIAILRRYLDEARPRSIELLLFDSSGVERRRVANGAELTALLRAVRYQGATSLAALSAQDFAGIDACLLFSDGLVTIDRSDSFPPTCPIFAISSGADANRAYLRSLARNSGGEAFDLSVREAGEVLTRMTRRVPRVVDVRTSAGAPIDYTVLDGGEYGWRIVGPAAGSGDIVVRLAGVPSGSEQRTYAIPSGEAAEMNGASALWAAERVAVLAARDDVEPAALVALARRHSVASPEVSFLVLETGRDYAQAEIVPPASLPAEMRDEYAAVREQMKREETGARARRLDMVVDQWNEMRRWWGTRYPVASVADDRPGRGRRPPPVSSPSIEPVPQTVPSPPPPAPPPPPVVALEQRSEAAGADSGSIVVTGSNRTQAGAPSSPGASPRGSIAIEPWAANRPYLAALDEAPPADSERVFAEQQAQHGSLPAFWLDVSDWAWRKGRREDAVRLLLSALELPTRNSQTLSIVAERLMRYGEIDRAVSIFERLVAAEGDRPQPRRSLALALAKRSENAPREQARADLERALSLLTEVVTTPWNEAYRGIEMIALMEANRLIPRYRALGGDGLTLDPRLIALLDVDLRVVIEWYSEATDIDLWVDEPNGERAIYHNPRTRMGGRLSDDMTQGFGPEEYLMRRAQPGTYQVRSNIFSSDRLNPNGAQRVTARLIRDFGRPAEREEVVDIEILPDDDQRERSIGRIEFEGPAPRR
ncbi:VIT domain-containing protein [Allosphingosinicella sp.]|jgi:tetratricopeptide (TPR) repeat protein|uniref:VIT domain-containing protein n=1 Tax=Allosphingosinicella sp. TaxID=2823234 RepID=UPI002EFF2234